MPLKFYPCSLNGEFGDAKKAINRRATVDALPDSLLIEVFDYLRHLHGVENPIPPVFSLLAVCQRWHGVICSTRRFWQRIDVARNPEWLKLFLVRANKACLDITFHHRDFPHRDIPSMLAQHTAYIRSLCFFDAGNDWTESISRLLQHLMPALLRLQVVNPDRDRLLVGLELSGTRIPNLSYIKLVRCAVPGDVSMCKNLRVVDIYDCPLSKTLKVFLAALNDNTKVEDLTLGDSLVHLPGTFLLPEPTRMSPVELSRLRRFRLTSGIRPLLHQVLSHIHCPHATDITIVGNISGMNLTRGSRVFEQCLFTLPHRPNTIFPILNSATTLDLQVQGSDCELFVSSPGSRVRLAALDMVPSAETERDFTLLPLCVRDLVNLFSSVPITSVSIYTDVQGSGSAPTVSEWEAFFEAFPHLESLTVSGWGEYGSMWVGLCNAKVKEAALVQSSDVDVCCPGLKSVRAEGVSGFASYENLMDTMIDALRFRANRGSRLQELTLEICHADLEDGVQADWLPQLKEFVNIVSFEWYT